MSGNLAALEKLHFVPGQPEPRHLTTDTQRKQAGLRLDDFLIILRCLFKRLFHATWSYFRKEKGNTVGKDTDRVN